MTTVTDEDKLVVVVRCLGRVAHDHALRWELYDVVDGIDVKLNALSGDMPAGETYPEAFARYYHEGHVPKETLDEFYCRIVLEGLHNESR